MSKKNRADIVEILGKEFEYVRIDNIKKNPVIFFEDYSVDLCIKAYEKLKPKRIYIDYIAFDFLNDPLFSDLQEVRVYADAGTDIRPLNALKNLTSLWLSFNPGYEPTGTLDFARLPMLEDLHIQWYEDMQNLSVCNSTKSIYINDFPGSDLNLLKDLDSLQVLELYNSKLEALDGIEKMNKLISLKMTGQSNLKSVESFGKASLSKLKNVEISSQNDVKGLKYLSQLKALKSLVLDGMTHFDCAYLTGNERLRELDIRRVSKLSNEDELSQLTELSALNIQQVSGLESLDFLAEMPQLKKLDVSPWHVSVKKGFLPLVKKYRSLGKLETLFEWKPIIDHLDEDGKKQYLEYCGDSPLTFIKNEFKFHCYEDYSEPYTKENCHKVDVVIKSLVDQLIENEAKSTQEKLGYFEVAADVLDQIDEKLNLFATGEREYLWDTLDKIAEASGIDVDDLEESESENRFFKWPVF